MGLQKTRKLQMYQHKLKMGKVRLDLVITNKDITNENITNKVFQQKNDLI
jgi:hypothetical protein